MKKGAAYKAGINEAKHRRDRQAKHIIKMNELDKLFSDVDIHPNQVKDMTHSFGRELKTIGRIDAHENNYISVWVSTYSSFYPYIPLDIENTHFQTGFLMDCPSCINNKYTNK